MLPKKAKLQMQILEKHDSEELTVEYINIAKQIKSLNNPLHISAIILIILMTIKPF
jgi:hypothetical protein